MDCIATGEVHRVVERSERAGVEPGHLAVDREASHGREPPGKPCGGDGDDEGDAPTSDDVQHLVRLVDLDVACGLEVAGNRPARRYELTPERRVDDTGAVEPLHLLKRVDRIEEARVEHGRERRRIVQVVQVGCELHYCCPAGAVSQARQDAPSPRVAVHSSPEPKS